MDEEAPLNLPLSGFLLGQMMLALIAMATVRASWWFIIMGAKKTKDAFFAAQRLRFWSNHILKPDLTYPLGWPITGSLMLNNVNFYLIFFFSWPCLTLFLMSSPAVLLPLERNWILSNKGQKDWTINSKRGQEWQLFGLNYSSGKHQATNNNYGPPSAFCWCS